MAKEHPFILRRLIESTSFDNWVFRSNREDIIFWDAWIKEHPEYEVHLYKLATIIKGIAHSGQYIDYAELERDKRSVVACSERMINNERKVRIRRRSVVVSFILIIALALGFIFAPDSSQSHHWVTGDGQIITQQLEDGTQVTLNANSELTYYQEGARGTCLKGEAYFSVEKRRDGDPPFSVHTEHLRIEVLGTQFNVNNRKDSTLVYLSNGRLNVYLANEAQDSIELTPGQLLVVSNKDDKRYAIRWVLEDHYTSWKDGILDLDNANLEFIIDQMKHTYNVSIVVDDEELLRQRHRIPLPLNNLELALEVISKVTKTNCTYLDSDTIFLTR